MAKTIKEVSPTDNDQKNRTSFNLSLRVVKKTKIIAASEGTDMSAIVGELLEGRIVKYEKEHGPITIK